MKSLRQDYWICYPLNLPTRNSEEPPASIIMDSVGTKLATTIEY